MNETNNGFFDMPEDDRSSIMEYAAQCGELENFFDLNPDERAAAYNHLAND